MNYEDWLAHFNSNHDPDTGQFSSNKSGSSAKKEMKKVKKFEKAMASGNRAAGMYYASAAALEKVVNSKGLSKLNAKKAAADLYDLAEQHRSKMNKYLDKLNKQGVKTTVSNKADLDRLASELGKVIKKRGFGYKVNAKDIDKIITNVKVPIKDLPINYITSGRNFVNDAYVHNTAGWQAARQAITDANRAMSLAVTAGTNPFMFG